VKNTKHSSARNIYLIAAVLWTLLIAYLCLATFRKLPRIGVQGADKYIHVTFHFVFTLLWFLYLRQQNGSHRKVLLRIFLTSLIYGILIEIAQGLFTTTRTADVTDVLANTAGAMIAAAIILLKSSIKK
jgi:VanZ family protein